MRENLLQHFGDSSGDGVEFVVVKGGEGSGRPVRQAELLTVRSILSPIPGKSKESRSLIRIIAVRRKRKTGYDISARML